MKILVLYIIFLLALKKDSEADSPELLQAIKSGNHKAFKQFFEKHHAFLYHFLLKKGISEQQAEDLVQQAFVIIWNKREEIDPRKSLRSYLFRIAYTRMLNLIRDHAKFEDSPDEIIDSSETTPDQDIANKELGFAIENAINSMPEKRQMVFRLCFIQEFTYKETAEILEVSVKTVENHMGLALKQLRGKLEGFREL